MDHEQIDDELINQIKVIVESKPEVQIHLDRIKELIAYAKTEYCEYKLNDAEMKAFENIKYALTAIVSTLNKWEKEWTMNN